MDYAEKARELDARAFVTVFTSPFLVGDNMLRPPSGVTTTSHTTEPTTKVRVVTVVPVKKTQALFPEMITVGRTVNNDVVLGEVSISGFHAFFKTQPDSIMTLTDAGSSNGTFLGARQLEPNVARAIALGDEIRFAKMHLRLLSPQDTWQWVRSLP